MKITFILITILSVFAVFISCESEAEKKQREVRLEQTRIEQKEKNEQEKLNQAIRDKYISNSLSTGTTPYAYCFGSNNTCSDNGCSQIKVKTPNNSDVLVTIKRNTKVYRHAYIKAGSNFTFELPNGIYQPFFYYGKGWNPEKIMIETDCGTLKGGFVAEEQIGKDSPQSLNNNILEYELILQQNGNFSTSPSNSEEAF